MIQFNKTKHNLKEYVSLEINAYQKRGLPGKQAILDGYFMLQRI